MTFTIELLGKSPLRPLGLFSSLHRMKNLRLLVAYSAQAMSAQTILEYASMLKGMDGFDVSFVHVTHGAVMDFDMNEYDVVFNNYCARHCFEGYISASYIEKLKNFRGLKVISVQDDGDRTSTLHRAIRECGFHVLITAVPDDTINYGYPPEQLPGVEIFKAYTGYVPEDYLELQKYVLPLRDRPILLGYRGRNIGGRYGKLGFYKFEIGRRMQEICDARGLRHDISMREEDRIYGTDWYAFTGRCRAVLGTESGSNVWDFDGTIEKQYQDLSAKLGRPATYEEFMPLVEEIEKLSNIGEISPRHFEAAVLRTPMVLFTGRYSDILEPWTHYIPLEKDFSNVDEVFTALDDIPLLEKVVERAYEDLVLSGQYTYRAFGEKLGAMIRLKYAQLAEGQAPLRGAHNITQEKLLDANNISDTCEWPTPDPQHKDVFILRDNRKYFKLMNLELTKVHDFFHSQALAFQKQTSEIAPWAADKTTQIEALCASRPEWAIPSGVGDLLDPTKLLPLANDFAELAVLYGSQCQEMLSDSQRVPGAGLSHVEKLSPEEIKKQLRFEVELRSKMQGFMDALQIHLAQLVQGVSYPYNHSVMIFSFIPLRNQLVELGHAEHLHVLDEVIGSFIRRFVDLHYDGDLKIPANKSATNLQEMSESLSHQLEAWKCRVWGLEHDKLLSELEHNVTLAAKEVMRLSARLALSSGLQREKKRLQEEVNRLLEKCHRELEQGGQSGSQEAESAVAHGDWERVQKLAAEQSACNENIRRINAQLVNYTREMEYFPVAKRLLRKMKAIVRRCYWMFKADKSQVA